MKDEETKIERSVEDPRVPLASLEHLLGRVIGAHVIFDPTLSLWQRLLFDITFKPGMGTYRYQDEVTQDCGETFTVNLPRKFKKVTVSFTNGKDGHCPIIVTILNPDETDATKQEKGKTRTSAGNDGSVTGEDGKRVTFKCDGKSDDGTCHFNFDLLAN